MNERLTREDVVDAAVTIVETEGLDALSMRSLSDKLGVAVTSIYWHVGNKDAVLDALVDRISSTIVAEAPAGGSPRERIIHIARSVQDALEDHGQLVAVAYRRGRLAAVFAPARRSLAVEFHGVGLRGQGLADAVNLVLQYVAAYCTTRGVVAKAPEADLWTMRLWDDEPPVDREAAVLLDVPNEPVQTFRHGLDVIVRALIASA